MTTPPLHTQEWGPKAAQDIVIMIHGIESHSGWFSEVGALLGKEQVRCLAFDRSGFGQSSGSRGHIASLRACLGEVQKIRDLAIKTNIYDMPRLHLIGMSWGGLLSAYLGSLQGSMWSTVTMVAPAVFTKRIPNLKYLSTSIVQPRFRIPLPIALSDFSTVPEIQLAIAQDPYRVTAVTLATLIHTIRLQKKMRQRITLPKSPKKDVAPRARSKTQVLLGTDDTLIDVKKTASWAYQMNHDVAWAKGASHSLVRECPEWVADMVLTLMADPLASAGRPYAI
jgi:alpha-beta hydrolase superfamily lysophospholipase